MLALLLLGSGLLASVCLTEALRLRCGPFTRLAIAVALSQLPILYGPLYLAYGFDLGVERAGTLATAALSAIALGAGLGSRARLASLARELAAALPVPAHRPLVVTGALLVALLGWLHHTHYLRPLADGLHSAGVTWGDLPLHAGLASRFLEADGLPALEHPLFAYGALLYPFVPDYGVAVLSALGLGLRGAFVVSGMYGLLALVVLVHALTRSWLGGTRARPSVLALLLFFFAGGFGFVFFGQRMLEGASLLQLLRTTNATYDISPHVAKAGHVGNLLLASRCASYGMPLGLAALLVFQHGREHAAERRLHPLLAGVALGALPLVHTHSFLVVGFVLTLWVLTARPRPDLARAALCLGPALVLAIPQLLFLSGGGERSYLRFAPGFLRPAPSMLDWGLDLVLGMGLPLLLLPLALRASPSRARRLAWPLLLLLPLANLIALAPALYDNVKLVAWFDLAAAVLLAGFFARLLDGGAALRRVGAALGLLGCTLSGALAVGFELSNDGLVLSTADQRFARLVEAHTPPDAVIASAARYHDPVVMLAGRRVLLAAPLMVRLNGIDVAPRAHAILQLYAGGPAALEVIERLDVHAVVVGPSERAELPRLDEAFLQRHARARYATDDRALYVLHRQTPR